MSSRTVIAGCTIYSLATEGKRYAGMLVEPDGRIEDLYGAREMPEILRRAKAEGQPVIDFGGATVLPAFTDAHAHLMPKMALSALGVQLSRFSGGGVLPDSLEAVAATLIARGQEQPKGPVVGYGLAESCLAERRLPTAAELDAWLPGRPVIILSADGRSSSYSTQALLRLGLHDLSEDGILRDVAHTSSIESVMQSVTASADTQQLAEGFTASLAEAANSGIASIHCMEHSDEGQPDPCLAMLRRQGSRVPQTLRLYLQYPDPADFAPILKTLARPRAGGGGAWAMDGSLASHSAAFEVDYLDRPGFRGSLHYSSEEAYALIAPFALSGFQTAVHALGTRGIESALGAYERVLHETGDLHNDLRLRIEHFSFPRPDQIQRAGSLGILTVVQPGRHWVDHHVLHHDESILDSATRSLAIPLRSMVQAGCRIALSAEAPIQGLDPFIQIAGAVDHPDPEQRLSLFEALRAATQGGAFAAFDEDSRGTLGRGTQADFVVLDGDPFLIPPEHIWALHVRETWIAGRKFDPEPLKKRSFISGILGSPARRL